MSDLAALSLETNTSISTHLEDVSCQLVNLIHLRQFDDPMLEQYLDKNIHASWDLRPSATTREQYLIDLNKLIHASPDYGHEIVNCCSSIKSSRRRATVWITLNVSGVPIRQYGGVSRESVVLLEWRWSRRGWKCIRKKGVRGSAPFGGFLPPMGDRPG
ncbi:hypothetical protein LTR10_001737 [Elasticomyces elasticus]|nr:hypothetical protein LTR10_001737 [Elasticomyces elasticus]